MRATCRTSITGPVAGRDLFHHLLNEGADTYVTPALLEVRTQQQLDALLEALQRIVDRHDILRTAVMWQGLARPVQVVYRQVRLPVSTVRLEGDADVLEQWRERMSLRRLRMDLRTAPLMRVEVGRDERSMRWYVLLVQHHLVSDHVSLEIVQAQVAAQLRGEPAVVSQLRPYREYVAQALQRRRDSRDGSSSVASLRRWMSRRRPSGC